MLCSALLCSALLCSALLCSAIFRVLNLCVHGRTRNILKWKEISLRALDWNTCTSCIALAGNSRTNLLLANVWCIAVVNGIHITPLGLIILRVVIVPRSSVPCGPTIAHIFCSASLHSHFLVPLLLVHSRTPKILWILLQPRPLHLHWTPRYAPHQAMQSRLNVTPQLSHQRLGGVM